MSDDWNDAETEYQEAQEWDALYGEDGIDREEEPAYHPVGRRFYKEADREAFKRQQKRIGQFWGTVIIGVPILIWVFFMLVVRGVLFPLQR